MHPQIPAVKSSKQMSQATEVTGFLPSRLKSPQPRLSLWQSRAGRNWLSR